MIDYDKALHAFQTYVKNYDANDGKVRLKIVHTMKVAELSEMIARGIGLDEENVQLAKVIGLLHDIGRFEQLRRFHDFRDYLTVDHAQLGVEILKENHLIRSFVEDEKYDDIIFQTISNHNKYAIADGLNKNTLTHAKIIRDADKTDIFRVHIEDPVDDFLFIKDDEIKQSKISKEIEKQFYEGHCIASGGRKSGADVYVMRLAFMYDVNYVPALEYIQKQNYLRRMIDRIGFENPDTIHTFDAMLQTIEKNMKKRIETNE